MGLDRRFPVMLVQRREVLFGEPPALGVQMHGDGRAEDGQATAQCHNLLLMQSQKRAVHQTGHVLDLGAQ